MEETHHGTDLQRNFESDFSKSWMLFSLLLSFCLLNIFAFPCSIFLILPSQLSLPGFFFLFSALWLTLKMVYSRIRGLDLESGKVFLNKWIQISVMLYNVLICAMAVSCYVRFFGCQIIWLEYLLILGAQGACWNRLLVEIAQTQKSDLGLSLSVVTAWLCALRKLLYIPGFCFLANQMRFLICHISRTSSSKSLWRLLIDLDSPHRSPPKAEY